MKKLVYVLPFLSLLACEKEIDYEIPNPRNKVVIDARLEYGEPLEIYLSESVYSLSSEDPRYRDDFQAWLYTDEAGSPFPFKVESNNLFSPPYVYRLNHPLIPGQNYRIVVQSDDLPKASAEERLLPLVEISNFNYNREEKEFDFTFRDDPSTEDYYMITVDELDANSLFFSSLDLNLEFFEFNDFFGDSEFDGRQFGYRAFLSDANFNGAQRQVKLKIEQETSAIFVELKLHHISKSYYRHELTKSAANNSDGFFSEPVQVFSNIQNGYGIMATSTSDAERVQF